MQLAHRIRYLLLSWVLLEILVFIGLAHWIGLGWTLLAGFATTLLGFSLMKRAGVAASIRLRAALQGRHDPGLDDVVDGTMVALAAAALVIPGFLTDAFGVAMAIPPFRALFAR